MARQDKKQWIMQAAEKLFAGGRFHEITTDDVAREARVGKGTIYRYFKDKDELFFETANNGFDELCQALHRSVPSQAGFREQLRQACVQIVAFFRNRQEWFAMMQAQERLLPCMAGRFSRRWMQRRQGLVDALAGILRVGVDEGLIRRDIPGDVLANFLLGMLRTRERDLGGAPAAMRKYDVVIDVFCRGAGAAGPNESAGKGLPRRRGGGKDSAR